MSITELSIKRPSFIIVVFIVITILGVFSYKQLAYELIPKFSAPFVIIQTLYPGANPSEVENSVTRRGRSIEHGEYRLIAKHLL